MEGGLKDNASPHGAKILVMRLAESNKTTKNKKLLEKGILP